MRFFQWVIAVSVAAAVLGWTGCLTSRPPLDAADESCVSDLVQMGDKLVLTLSDVPPPVPADYHLQVKQDGSISLPLGVSIQAANKKLTDVEHEILTNYVPRYYRQLSVALKPEERWYSVGGEVRQPGRQFHVGTVRVLQALQGAGDFTDFANRRKVEVIRSNGRHLVIDCIKARRDQKLNIIICPGDAVHVPRSL